MLRLVFVLLLISGPAFGGSEAFSADGKWRASIQAPDRLVIYAVADNSIGAAFHAETRAGIPAVFEGVYVDPSRRNFIVPLKDIAQYWLIATDPEAPPVYEGFVHSHEAGMIEALPSSEGLFARRRIETEHALQQLEFSADYREMTALTPDGALRVTLNLYVNREIAWEPVK